MQCIVGFVTGQEAGAKTSEEKGLLDLEMI